MDVTSPHAPQVRPGAARNTGALWVGVIGPPLVFLVHLQAGYALAALACRQNDTLSLHIASVLGIILAVGLGLLSVRGWRREGRHWPDSSASLATRDRFLAVLGAMITGLVVLTLIAQWIPIFYIHPCR